MSTLSIASAQGSNSPGVHHHPLADSGSPYGYLSFIPRNYDAKSGRHPLVIFLHGKGELGDSKADLVNLAKHGPFKLINKDPAIFDNANAVVLAPQGIKEEGWWKWPKLDAFLAHALATYAIDKDRVYLTGLSMGGGGTWMLANSHPKTFAALVPICGAAKPGKSIQIGDVPIWAFHSIDDKVVGFDNTELWLCGLTSKSAKELMEGYSRAGKPATQSANFDGTRWVWSEGQHAPKGPGKIIGLTVYPDGQHDSWTRAYQDPQLWQWLFAQRR